MYFFLRIKWKIKDIIHHIKMGISKKYRIRHDCYDLDHSLFDWLQEHLPVYFECADKFVDLDFHRFEYKGNEYTEKELVKRMIELINILNDKESGGYFENECSAGPAPKNMKELKNEFFDLLSLTFGCLWW